MSSGVWRHKLKRRWIKFWLAQRTNNTLKNAAASDKAFLESEFNRLMPKISPERREQIMQDALVYVGLPAKKLEDYESLGVWQVLAGSIAFEKLGLAA